MQWSLGKVEQLFFGADDQVRGAKVRVKAGHGRSAFLSRPVQKLYPLELRASIDEQQQDQHHAEIPTLNEDNQDHVADIAGSAVSTPEQMRPRRAAARRAEAARKKLLELDQL